MVDCSIFNVMWVKQCHKPPMTGNGNHTTYKNGDLGDGLWHCFTHIVFSHMRVSINGGTSIAGWFVSWKINKVDDEGVPPF